MSSFGGFDPDRAMDKLRQLAADAPAYMADGFGRFVQNAPPERLEQLMRSPARKPALDGIFWQMPKQVNPEIAKDMTTTIRWRITGRPNDGVDVYQLEVDKGDVKTVKGESGEPKLTVTMDAVEFLKLASGNLDPMQAYFKGRIELTGDIMVAAKLAQLFKLPGGGTGGSSGGGTGGSSGGGTGGSSGGGTSGSSGGGTSGGSGGDDASGGGESAYEDPPEDGPTTPFSPPPTG